MSEDIFLILLFLLGLISLGQWIFLAFEARSFEIRSKSLVSSKKKPDRWPTVSVIVPARNEDETLASCLDSLARQDYQNLEILTVNDRSSDRTPEIMRNFASKDSRFKVIEIQELPKGWLGKNHALQKGATAALGEILLFTDGDVIFEPSAIREAIEILEAHQLDHLVLAPKFPTGKTLLAAMQCFFSVIFLAAIRPSRIGRSPRFYIGSGSFNMVSRAAYVRSGEHRRLRLEVIDDVMLGKSLVQASARQAFVDGGGLVKVEWYKSVGAMIRGLEKNAFASLRYSVLRFLFYSVANFWFYFLPYLLIIQFGFSWQILPFYCSVFLMHLIYGVAAFRMGYSPLIFPLLPLASWFLWFTYLRSMVLCLWRGQVIWRETAYTLRELRENMLD